jgi:hypothetical protein
MPTSTCTKPRPSRWLIRALAVGGALAWGVVELLALQRSRYSAWRARS